MESMRLLLIISLLLFIVISASSPAMDNNNISGQRGRSPRRQSSSSSSSAPATTTTTTTALLDRKTSASKFRRGFPTIKQFINIKTFSKLKSCFFSIIYGVDMNKNETNNNKATKRGVTTMKALKFPTQQLSTRKKKEASLTGLGRILREAKSFTDSPPKYLELTVDGKDIRSWIVTVTGPPGTVYYGEKYRLKMEFPIEYPSRPPIVYFLKPVPRHVHVYSNGDICLNLLGTDWNPMLSAESLALSILSMMSSAKEKTTPLDNANHASNPPGKQGDNWMYHDDHC